MPSPIAGQSTGANAQHTPPPPPDNTPRTRAKTRMEKAHTPDATTKKDHIAPAETQQAKSPAPSPPLPSPPALLKVASMIEQITTKHSLPGQVKRALVEVVDYARKAAEMEESKGSPTVLIPVKAFHEQLRSDLRYLYSALEAKFTDLQAGQSKLLTSAESLNKTSENLQTSTRELEGKVDKVTVATDRIVTTTTSYRDALLAKPAGQNKSNANPKVISDLERKDRQVLVGYSSAEDNATLGTSLLALKDKANQILASMDDPSRPELTKVDNITRTRDGSLLLLFNSKEAVTWIKNPDKEDKFIDNFAVGAYFRDRSYNILLRWVPTTFDPDNRPHLREVEEANSLPDHSIQKARWIKPTMRRRAGQTRAHAILTLTTADTANQVIRNGVDICGIRARAEKSKLEPLQCLKCRGWEHKAQNC